MRTPGRDKNAVQNRDRPNKRTIDGRPICNTLWKPGHISRSCPKGKGCFNCGETGHFSRQCPTRKPEDGQQKSIEPSKKSTNSPAGQLN